MRTQEIAKKIRAYIKSLGYKARAFSVTTTYNTVRIEPKEQISIVELAKIEEYADKFESIDTCKFTQEILLGGNVYIYVYDHLGRYYSWDSLVKDARQGWLYNADKHSWYYAELLDMGREYDDKVLAEIKETETEHKKKEALQEIFDNDPLGLLDLEEEADEIEDIDTSNDVNTYSKYAPNVYLAKCPNKHSKGDTINVTTKRGKINESIVFNLIYEKDGYYYYSIIRSDGMNAQEYAKKKAEKFNEHAANAQKKSNEYAEKNKDSEGFRSLAEPIKVGHHSEKRHRKLYERVWADEEKRWKYNDKAKSYEEKSEYWKSRADVINLSMPESVSYFEFKLEEATKRHKGIKSGEIKRQHSYDLSYAKKEANAFNKFLGQAKKLWA